MAFLFLEKSVNYKFHYNYLRNYYISFEYLLRKTKEIYGKPLELFWQDVKFVLQSLEVISGAFAGGGNWREPKR